MNLIRLVPFVFFAVAAMMYFNTPSGPPDNAFVDDRAGLLSEEQRQRVLQTHRAILSEEGIHLHLVTLASTPPDLAAQAKALMEQKKVGEHTQGRGLLLLVDPGAKQILLQVDTRLETIFTKPFVTYVEQQQMPPFFADNRADSGVETVVSLLLKQARGEVEAARYQPNPGHTGAKAPSTVAEGSATDSSSDVLAESFRPAKVPINSLYTYIDVLEQRVKLADLPLYTAETRALRRQQKLTDTQQADELAHLKRKIASALILTENDRTVIRFPVRERRSHPYFFKRNGGQRWELDLATLQQVVEIDAQQEWFLSRLDHPYAFAFPADRLDEQGYLR